MITMSKALTITVFSMILVFVTLIIIFFILKAFKIVFYKEESMYEKISKNEDTKYVNEIDEEEKVVIALAASIIAGQGKKNPNFQISSIKRIK
ncbi:OadG family protein [Clostridium sp. D2Q-14]|uniref:OadG family protein n=1 Tax=Anaeromonas gelatinilytica TaxID=2683194 RepID=UPI00193B9E17|nr:OadG family protein [Anaeromonas gelatinilytica]MBS4534733.1 OadG family protein [Anaeromonas gelatinilytica]